VPSLNRTLPAEYVNSATSKRLESSQTCEFLDTGLGVCVCVCARARARVCVWILSK
jgi:hypothetical protein